MTFPFSNGLFNVKIVKPPAVLIGPLQDDMIVSAGALGDLIRQTAVCALSELSPALSQQLRTNRLVEVRKSMKAPRSVKLYQPQFN